MIVLHLCMQREDIFEHTNGKCHVFTFQYARGSIRREVGPKEGLSPLIKLSTTRRYWAGLWKGGQLEIDPSRCDAKNPLARAGGSKLCPYGNHCDAFPLGCFLTHQPSRFANSTFLAHQFFPAIHNPPHHFVSTVDYV